jgi:hypothetical protein
VAPKITLRLECVILRTDMPPQHVEFEPRELTVLFEIESYSIGDKAAVIAAPGKIVLGLQGVKRPGKPPSYALFRGAEIELPTDSNAPRRLLHLMLKVPFVTDGPDPLATAAFPVSPTSVAFFEAGTLDQIQEWKLLLKQETQGGTTINRLFYLRPQGGGASQNKICDDLDCGKNNEDTIIDCLLNGCQIQ